MRASNQAKQQERMVLGDAADSTNRGVAGPQKTKSKAKAKPKPTSTRTKKPKPRRPQVPTGSDWSQAVGLLLYNADPTTRAEIHRLALALGREALSPGRQSVYAAIERACHQPQTARTGFGA